MSDQSAVVIPAANLATDGATTLPEVAPTPHHQPYDLSKFVLESVLSNATNRKMICCLGRFTDRGTDADRAIVILEKTAFAEAELCGGDDDAEPPSSSAGYFRSTSRLRELFVNDIYGNFECFPCPDINRVKTTIIYPATENHIIKHSAQEVFIFDETPADYAQTTLPYIQAEQFSLDTMELSDLPNDVLLNILERLQIFELCAVSRTCHHLSTLAHHVAGRRYKYLDYEQVMHAHGNFRSERCATDFRAAMRFIGPHVQRMRFDGNWLKKHRSSLPAVPLDKYEQHYEHTAAITVELKDFARFDYLMPLVDNHFTQLCYMHMSFEAAEPGCDADAWKTRPVDGVRVLNSVGFHVDDTRLTYIFQHWPVDELYIRCPDLEKTPIGGGGAGGSLEWSGFKGRALCELADVRRLELRYCNKVQPQHFQQFTINNADVLRHMVISECAQLNGSQTVFRDIALHLMQLQHLDAHFLDTCPPLGRLTELHELRVLRLNMASDCDRLLEDLAINDRLDELHITDCLVDFTADGFEAGGEFFTHLRAVTLHGNVLDGRALQRFANADWLQVMRFTYDASMADGLVELVHASEVLAELEMYCTEWVSVETVQRLVDTLSSRKNAAVLQLRLTLELYDEDDRADLEALTKKLMEICMRHEHLINIVIV